MIFVGIDPGKQGSVSIINGKDLTVIPTPMAGEEYDMVGMYNILVSSRWSESFAVIERAQSMPGQGVSSMFSFGKGYGLWLMALAISKMPHQIVHSRVWTKKILAGAPGEGKERSFQVARRLYPQWQPRLKKEHQYSDSILLAEYCKRLYLNKEDGKDEGK